MYVMEQGDAEERSQMELALEVGKALNQHYPNHPWVVGFQGGGIVVRHLFIALAVQAVVGLLTGNWWAGAALGVGVFIGREHAQAEYRWIERYGQGRRANLPWWGWADRRVWDVHSWWWNLTLPVVAVVAIAGVVA